MCSHAPRMEILDDIITPEELAKRMGWSARRVRQLARELGACRLLGRNMRLTKEDVETILEATKPKPKPLSRPLTFRDVRNIPGTRIPDVTYEDLVRMRESDKLNKHGRKRKLK